MKFLLIFALSIFVVECIAKQQSAPASPVADLQELTTTTTIAPETMAPVSLERNKAKKKSKTTNPEEIDTETLTPTEPDVTKKPPKTTKPPKTEKTPKTTKSVVTKPPKPTKTPKTTKSPKTPKPTKTAKPPKTVSAADLA